MCGIVGLVRRANAEISADAAVKVVERLLLMSQSRGKDSSGVAVMADGRITVLKGAMPARRLLDSPQFPALLQRAAQAEQFAIIGHTRMETNGAFSESHNNQPVVKDDCVVIHNGIIVNHADLWRQNPDLTRLYEVDTEIVNSLLMKALAPEAAAATALNDAFRSMAGSYTVATLFRGADALLLATNTGSLYELVDGQDGLYAFASERHFLEKLLHRELRAFKHHLEIRHVVPPSGVILSTTTLGRTAFTLQNGAPEPLRLKEELGRHHALKAVELVTPSVATVADRRTNNARHAPTLERIIAEEHGKNSERIARLMRCTRCVLPETMPFITFDAEGVCSCCHRHQPRDTRGAEALDRELQRFESIKSKSGPQCIVSFSGGRDSSWALHYVKKVLGLNPIAYSYDWGMLTDLGRRNQARMTGQLGAEHVLISADIQAKRAYIRKNVQAWLERPHLGVVPLFMAGDKQYFYHLNKLRRDTGVDLVIYAANPLEKTEFKYGFAGVELAPHHDKAYAIGLRSSLQLLWFYGSQYAMNPRYLNSSLLDTFTAYVSSYFIPKDYVYFYRYIEWEETTVERTLISEYDWELAGDTPSSWRIGDGTAAIYNYIYYTAAGLTEHDTFRSNQVREGVMSRDDALIAAQEGNRPRLESLLWYCDTIGIDALHVIERIHRMHKYY